MFYINVKTQTEGLLKTKNQRKVFVKVLQAGAAIVHGKYVREVPVNRGDLRRKTKIEMTDQGFKVYTTAKYATYVHEGTGKYRGRPDAGYHTGRVRKSRFYGAGSKGKFESEMLPFFKMLARKGKIKGQKPNKFAERAYRKAKSPYTDFITSRFNELSQKYSR